MLFELINPSDAYTFEAESLEAATLAVLFLGNGAYGAEQIDGDADVPVFLLGGADEWCQEKFGASLEQCLVRSMESVASVLESFIIGTAAGKTTCVASPSM